MTVSPNEAVLVETAIPFLQQLKDLTPGKALEAKLNSDYGPGSDVYEKLAKYARLGLDEGWLANIEIDGPHYRRSRLRSPCEELSWFSITAVYMDSRNNAPKDPFHGQYHAHPYGEINMVIPVKGDHPELEGLNGWMHKGWTCPGPGSHHFPAVRGGSLIALFFLPAGRISYNAKPGDAQPQDVGTTSGL